MDSTSTRLATFTAPSLSPNASSPLVVVASRVEASRVSFAGTRMAKSVAFRIARTFVSDSVSGSKSSSSRSR